MSESIKHECGIAMIRLLKPLDYYREKYGSAFYGLNKLCLLMEKQHNRGQDGAGIASIKFDVPPGVRYISRQRSNRHDPLKDIFSTVNSEINTLLEEHPFHQGDIEWLKNNARFCGELYVGHLRYGTFGRNSVESCHPFIRENNWQTRTLITAGNFNLTNVDTLFRSLIGLGQHPLEYSDNVTMLEMIGYSIDEENTLLYKKFKNDGYPREEISKLIAENLDLNGILKHACKKWDGGFVCCGLLGHGDAFVIRDPAGIRPVFYYKDDEVLVVTSERPPIQTAFNVPAGKIKEIPPAHALIIKKDKSFSVKPYISPLPRKSCSFERIYFSRGSDKDIYNERKNLGRKLVPAVLEAINHDIENTVFSFIPNTAETCFFGMADELNKYCCDTQIEKLKSIDPKDTEAIKKLIHLKPRFEKVAVKDAKLRTFISDDSQRNELAAHVYDITYGVVRSGIDSLVIIDDSIVRGTTMRESILRILDRTGPKKIVVVSSAPQIRYPDCYGIDMARLRQFIAFEAAVELIKENGMADLLKEVYEDARHQLRLPMEDMVNAVKKIYEPFTADQISIKIGEMLRPDNMNAEVEFIYQRIEDLHESCPEHLGDWYFTGNYPTPGGNKVVNQSYVNYIEGSNKRAY
ncbi:MAG: amidophosphoribosyltransferase [Lentisphaerae bacterium]|nr:amidophosphoribosyltransferase [Lentisphaerota bacterium]MCP4100812.1 amidophosphoribosyltransferase [Lentisphaerota bacterium]